MPTPRHRRRVRRAVAFSCGALLLAAAGPVGAAPALVRPAVAWDPARFIGVDELKPGMTGYGLTVVTGTRIDTFRVEVIAVRKNFFPQSDVILAMGSGLGMEESGIVAGMSGSPVYFDGRLAGALAYGWPYMTRPIMGITPIAAMLPMTRVEAPGPDGAGGAVGGAASPERRDAWRRLLVTTGGEARPLLEALMGQEASGGPGAALPGPGGAAGGDAPRRIATPLCLSGMDARAAEDLAAWLAPFGLAPMPAGGAGAAAGEGPGPDDLVPGAAVGLQFVRGDVSMAALGTVTFRDGERILAFGHPMFQRGRSRIPMTTATVEKVMPRLSSSFKFGSAARPVGTIDIDLNSGIGGSLGALPAMIPMTLTIADDLPDAARTFRAEILDNETLLPVLAGTVVLNAAMAAGVEADEATVAVTATIRLADGRSLTQTRRTNATAPAMETAMAVFRPLALLAQNPLETVHVASIDVSLSIVHRVEQLTLEEVVLGTPTVPVGGRIDLAGTFRNYRGERMRRAMSLDVPADLPPGEYRLRACDAGADRQWDVSRAPGLYDPTSVDQMLAMLAAEKPNDRLVLSLVRTEPGVTADGMDLGHLPPSVLSALAAPGVTGPFALTQFSVVATTDVQFDAVVDGCHELTVRVLPDLRGSLGRNSR